MTKKKFEDLDIDDIPGVVELSNTEGYYEDAIIITDAAMTTEEVEWEDCITRMEKHCMKSWICIPHIIKNKLRLEIHDIEKCNGDKFLEWLNLVWPPCKNMSHDASSYEELRYRQSALNSMVLFHQILKFPSSSAS